MTSPQSPVPRLDLAPKLRRPLSLWNPIDYLRLLYWVFYFPQAIRWYVEQFGEKSPSGRSMTWGDRWRWARQNPIKFRLFLQGLWMTLLIPTILCWILQLQGVPIIWFREVQTTETNWTWAGVIPGLGFNILSGLALCIGFEVSIGVVVGITAGITLGIAGGVFNSGILSFAVGILLNTLLVLLNIFDSVTEDVLGQEQSDENSSDWTIALGSIVLGGVVGISFIWLDSPINSLEGAISMAIIGVTMLRPETWCLNLLFNVVGVKHQLRFFSHVTPLPLIGMYSRLTKDLQRNWKEGIDTIENLLTYTVQWLPAIQAINHSLTTTDATHVIERVAYLFTAFKELRLVRSTTLHLLDSATPAHKAISGFQDLHDKYPHSALKKFAGVSSLLYGEEMFALSETLAFCYSAETLKDIAALPNFASPPAPFLRPKSWNAISHLKNTIIEARIVQQSSGRVARSFALNRALGELKTLLDQADTIPQAERNLIVNIAETWQKTLLGSASEVGQVTIREPVLNPYIAGDPVTGQLFAGREDIIGRLEELWLRSSQLQSVVLYGHRRMGKTSILRNIASHLGTDVKVAYVNLLNLGDVTQGVGEVFLAITDTVAKVTHIPAPAISDLLQLPYPTFRRFLQQVADTDQKLIIALDEFEQLEDLIQQEKISLEFFKFLRGLVQEHANIAFAFAGLHTLSETLGKYDHPFFASFIPIPVSFLNAGETRTLVANPSDEFPFDFMPDALDRIYTLTAGQPYLIQLIGFQLVRHYNAQVFESGRQRDPVFTLTDVDAVITDRDFFINGRYYFTGVWQQAGWGAPGQQEILQALAKQNEGCGRSTLQQLTGLAPDELDQALETLKRHDVVHEEEGQWQIIVPLFQQWVCNNL